MVVRTPELVVEAHEDVAAKFLVHIMKTGEVWDGQVGIGDLQYAIVGHVHVLDNRRGL